MLKAAEHSGRLVAPLGAVIPLRGGSIQRVAPVQRSRLISARRTLDARMPARAESFCIPGKEDAISEQMYEITVKVI